MMADREKLKQDLMHIEEYREVSECGDGCCTDSFEPLSEEAGRLRAELEQLWALEESVPPFPARYYEALENLYAGCKHTEATGDPNYREDAIRSVDAVLEGMRGK